MLTIICILLNDGFLYSYRIHSCKIQIIITTNVWIRTINFLKNHRIYIRFREYKYRVRKVHIDVWSFISINQLWKCIYQIKYNEKEHTVKYNQEACYFFIAVIIHTSTPIYLLYYMTSANTSLGRPVNAIIEAVKPLVDY